MRKIRDKTKTYTLEEALAISARKRKPAHIPGENKRKYQQRINAK